MIPKTCAHCERVALYRVGAEGFCGSHRDRALAAQRIAHDASRAMASARTGHWGNMEGRKRVPRGGVRLGSKRGYGDLGVR